MSAIAVPEALRACENVTTSAVARRAVAAWEMAATHGWPAVRASMPRRTWFHYLRILRRAGLPAPGGRGLAARPGAESPAAPEFDSGAPHLATYLQTAGGLLGIPGRRFRVARAWDPDTPAGTAGTVYAVLFRNGRWRVQVEMDDSRGAFDELALGKFANSTTWQDSAGDDSTSSDLD